MGRNSYGNYGFSNNFRKLTSLSSRQSRSIEKNEFVSALDQDLRIEKTAVINSTVQKGTAQVNLGGILEVRDSTGTNVLLSTNPETGVVTIAGTVQSNVAINIGTVIDTRISGTSSQSGTLNITGVISNGTFSGGTFNNTTVGTPMISGGTMNNVLLGSPVLLTSAGSTALPTDGGIAIKTHAGSAILAARLNGTTFYFASAGTLLP